MSRSLQEQTPHSWSAVGDLRFRSTPRSGFTLLELVVVIAILGILAGFALVGLGAALNSGRESQTRSVIAIADGVVRDRLEAYRSEILEKHPDYLVERQIDSVRTAFNAANSNNFSTSGATAAADAAAVQYLIRKSRFASVFPQRFIDLCGLDGRPGAPGVDDAGSGGGQDVIGTSTGTNNVFEAGAVIDLYELGLGGAATDDPAPASVIRAAVESLGDTVDLSLHSSQTESAELLYLCITNPLFPGFPTVRPDDIPASFLADSDGDGLVELIDGWGTPLRFYTSASGLLRGGVDSTTPTPVSIGWTWNTSGARTTIPTDRVALAFVLAGENMGIAPPPTGVSGADGDHPLNRDFDDRFSAVRVPGGAAASAAAQRLAPDPSVSASDGYEIPSGGNGPNLPIALGTKSFTMIVSAGPDEDFGLGDPTAHDGLRYAAPTASPFDLASSPAADNVTNLQGGPK